MIKIYYGSQTGNTKDYAEKLYFKLNNRRDIINISIEELDNLKFNEISFNDLCVILCSTTGQGDPPDNMKLFWRTIMSRKHPKIVNRFSVFGIGDSSYTQYNFIAKKLYRRLIQLGGSATTTLGLGDEQNAFGIEQGYNLWVNDLSSIINKLFRLKIDLDKDDCQFPKIFNVKIIHNSQFGCTPLPSMLEHLTVSQVERVTSNEHFQETKLIQFDYNCSYDNGDVLVVHPSNSQHDVDLFYEITKIDRTEILELSSCDRYFQLPKLLNNSDYFSVENLVSFIFDLNAVPNKSFFEKLYFYSSDEMEKERLGELVKLENLDELHDYCFVPKKSIVEVMRDFSKTTAAICIEGWLNILPAIRPREYSISSSWKVDKNICILVANVEYKTKYNRMRYGLCSSYLCNLKVGDKVISTIKKGTLYFPRDPKTPVLLISTGTGISALHGYIKESHESNRIILIFGCRSEKSDFYFSKDYKSYQQNESSQFQIITAFSRQNNQKKLYVQHRINEYASTIYRLLVLDGGQIILTGRALDMPNQVFDALVQVLQNECDWTKVKAESFLLDMQKTKRYQLETWN